MRKFTFFFAALLVALGVQAQSSAKDGYFDFAANVTAMTEINSAADLEPGMDIVMCHAHQEDGAYEHSPYWFSVKSNAVPDRNVHELEMYHKCSGLAIFTLVEAEGGYKLKCKHTDCSDTYTGACYLANSPNSTGIKTSRSYPGVYSFAWKEGKDGATVTLNYNSSDYGYYVQTDNGTPTVDLVNFTQLSDATIDEHARFKVYRVDQTEGTVQYVNQVDFELNGPGGNVFTGKHTGWSDMYNFALNNNVTVSDLSWEYNDDNTVRKIIGKITFPFPVSGSAKENYLYISPFDKMRVSVKDGVPTVFKKDTWEENDETTMWAIYPQLISSSSSSSSLRYVIKNKSTNTYLKHTTTNNSSTAGAVVFVEAEEATSFNVVASKSSYKGYEFKIDDSARLSTHTASLSEVPLGIWRSQHDGSCFQFSSVTIDAFQQSYDSNLQFWNDQVVTSLPEGLPTCNATDKVYRATRPIYVTNADGTVKVKFTYTSGSHKIVTLGVDVVSTMGQVLAKQYVSKSAGSEPNTAEYTLTKLPMGKCFLRYFVCHRADSDHDLTKTAGTIDVTGGVLAAQPQEATYEYYYNGAKFAELPQTVGHLYAGNKPFIYELPNRSYINYVAGVIPENTTVIRIDCTPGDLPFDAATDYESATWYMLKIRGKYMASKSTLPYTNDANTRPERTGGLWAFTGNAIEGIKVLNRLAGEDYALGCDNYNNQANLYMKPGGVAWNIKKQGDGFILYSNTSNAVHDHGGNLQIWNSSASLTDNGSIITVEDFDDSQLVAFGRSQLGVEMNQFKEDFDDSAWGAGWRDLPGVNNYTSTDKSLPGLQEAYETAKAAYDAFDENTTEVDMLEQIEMLSDVRAALAINQPENGYFYRLRHATTGGNYLSSVVSDDRLEMQGAGSDNPNLMFAYIDGGLIAYSNGLSIDAYRTLGVGSMGTASFVAANNGKGGQYNIIVGGRYIYGRGNTQNDHVDSGTGKPTDAGETGYNWWLEEVTALPVKLNYAADKGHCYATLWTPVALNVPAGVRAYVGTIEGTVLTLTEIEGSVIPANSGVLLWAEGVTATTTYNFEVNKTSTATLSDNAFVGTALTTSRNGEGYYSLGNKDGVTAFYNYTGANLQGFRARIKKDAASGVQALTLRFDDTTGIEEITSAFENAAVYDLSGRRVNAPQKGLYIVNGKKVYIK